jgi:hypothetical protein
MPNSSRVLEIFFVAMVSFLAAAGTLLEVALMWPKATPDAYPVLGMLVVAMVWLVIAAINRIRVLLAHAK